MNRRLTLLLAAFEAAVVAAIGIGIPLAAATVLWGFHFELSVGWPAFWRAAVDVWLLGHGVDVAVVLVPEVAAGLGVPEAAARFPLSIAALGIALLTVALGMRAGRRIAATEHRFTGEAAAVAMFALIALAAALSSRHPYADVDPVQATVLPAAVFAGGVLAGSTWHRLQHPPAELGSSLRDWIADWPAPLRNAAAAAVRGGLGTATVLLGAAALVLTIAILASYTEQIRLYEAVQAGPLGGAILTLGQLALLPNAVIWVTAWLVGPGFAIGAGSSVSPVATSLGPVPTVPLVGVLPAEAPEFGLAALMVPILAGFIAGAAAAVPVGDLDWRWRVGTGLGCGAVGGTVLGLLAAASAGGVGPGRLAVVGPDPVAVGGWAAAEIGIAAVLGVLAASAMPADRWWSRR